MIEVIETVWIPMPDGAKLAARLWLPEGARSTPAPVILEYIPYRRRDRTRMRDESMHPHFAAAGFASVRVDMRGAGDSDGVMLDEYSEVEIQDGVDVIAWLAAQPWCNGRVGMFGKSWGAYSAFQVAAKRPPALKGIAPVMGTDDRWLEDIHFYGGVPASDNFWWGAVMQLYNAMPPDPAIVGDDWRAMWKARLDAMTFWPAQWLEHQTHDAMWRRGSIAEDYDAIEAPVYFFGGWADLFRDTPFRIASRLRAPVKVLMGPWAHLYPHEAVPEPRIDFIDELIRFWRYCLNGDANGLFDEPRLRFWIQDSARPSGTHLQRAGEWMEEEVWPSPNIDEQALWLNAGTLDGEAKEGAPLSICSPQTFGSAGGDMCSFAIPGDMPADCRIDAAGALCFRGQVLASPLTVLGQPRVQLTVSADRPQAFVAALLVDESPDGAQTLIARGFANLMHRESDTMPTPVTPGEAVTVTVPLHGIGYQLARGHRLMVQIASTYWPVLWPAPAPVTLTVNPGQSKLLLPVRKSDVDVDKAPRELPPPPARKEKPPVTKIRDGAMERSLKIDLTDGTHTARFFLDGGVFGPVGRLRLDDTGTEMGDISERIYSIHPDDPLSARASMTQDCRFHRDDWSVRIKTTAAMRATKTHFLLSATVECEDGDKPFHRVEWEHKIPRNGM